MKNKPSVPTGDKSSAQKKTEAPIGGANPRLLELVSLRVAQLHRCPISMEMHKGELKAQGETNKRLDQLEIWEASILFDEHERAALAFCENITLNPTAPFPDYVIHEMRHHFTKAAIVSLTLAIMAVNDWNFS